jgi:hypothetical protein
MIPQMITLNAQQTEGKVDYKYELTRKDQSTMFLYGYYNRPVLWFQRRYSGPALIVIAVAYLILDHNPTAIYLAAFLAIIGAYYIARPFITRARHRFEKSSGTITTDKNGIVITNELGELRVSGSKILKAFVRGRYLFIKVSLNNKQYYMIDLENIKNDSPQLVADVRLLAQRPSERQSAEPIKAG